MKTDFLGQTYDVGDEIIYAAQSGRSVTMVHATVVKFNEKSTTVQPLASSRWTQHYGSTRYVDTRTGKTVDPYRSDKHWLTPSGQRHKVTGELMDPAERERLLKEARYGEPYRQAYYDFVGNYDYRSGQLQPYIAKVEAGPKPVSLTVTDNIVLFRKAAA